MFPGSSRRIIACINDGAVNGISLMANSPCLPECMEILKSVCRKKTALSIHLNIMTEKPLSDPEDVPDLIDDKGCFCITYGKLIKAWLLPVYGHRIRGQIKSELTLQILRCLPYFPEEEGIRIDSHRHFHMVPFIFDLLSEIISEQGLKVSYIRIINEKMVFYRGIGRFEYLKPLNIIKVLLLNSFSLIDRLWHGELWRLGDKDFASILFSGCMTKKNLGIILKNIERNPEGVRENIELMFHPGAVLEREDLKCIMDPEDRDYMSHPLRSREAEALKRL